MNSLKLNKLSNNELSEKSANTIKGGCGCCQCACQFASQGGASTSANASANHSGSKPEREQSDIIRP